MITAESNIKEIERYCNNYFNPRNDSGNPSRDHPAEFLELAQRILEFRQGDINPAIISESVIGIYKWTKATGQNGTLLSWAQVFAVELAIWKRARFI